MDWAGIILFVITILGAVAFSQGSLIGGFFAFLIIGTILAAIRELFKKFALAGDPIKEPASTSANTHITLDEEFFMSVHSKVMEFLQAYSEERSDEWYHYFISQEFEHIGDTTYGYVQFQIMLDGWHDSLLRNEPDLKDYMVSIFAFDPGENTFTYKMRSGTCSGCSYPQDEITKKVHKYVSNYETNHPGVRFERHSWGAKYSNI